MTEVLCQLWKFSHRGGSSGGGSSDGRWKIGEGCIDEKKTRAKAELRIADRNSIKGMIPLSEAETDTDVVSGSAEASASSRAIVTVA